MPVDAWLAIESVGFLVALTLVVYGVAKLNIKLTAAAGVVACTIWLLAAWSNPVDELKRSDYLILRFRVVDKATATSVRSATIRVVGLDESGREIHYRLATTASDATNGSSSDTINVSLFATQQIRGSLLEQFHHPEACLELEDQMLEVVAPDYVPWHGSLKQLVSDGGNEAAPIVIELQRMKDQR